MVSVNVLKISLIAVFVRILIIMTIMTIMTIIMMMMILLIMVKKGAAAFCCCRLTSPVTKPDQRRAPGTQNIKTYPKYCNLLKIL